jgi:hypothetical protein
MTISQSQGPFTWSDGWILAALITSGGQASVTQLVAQAEYLNRSLPTYDELSFGLARLVAAHLVEVSAGPAGGLLLTPTHQASGLVEPGPMITMMFELIKTLCARPYPENEVEDRSQGRRPGLELAEVEAALSDSLAWRSKVPPAVFAAFERVGLEQQGISPTSRERRRRKRSGGVG